MKKFLASLALLASFVPEAYAEGFSARSDDYVDGMAIANKHVFNGFGCSGENVSPQISWNGAPEGTKSYAVTIYDPDAPTGSGWWHWVVFNIPVSITQLPQGASALGMPEGAIQSRTDFGAPGYGGPCPPEGHGDHHYILTVHALDTDKLDLDKEASGALVGYMLNQHGLGKAQITALYSR